MTYEPNTNKTMERITKLTSIPSPTGNTGNIIETIAKDLAASKIQYKLNNKGGLIVTLAGKDDTKQRMLTAHVDTLGAMVKEIKADGRLLLSLIGGYRFNAIEGEYCTIETSNSDVYNGTILMHQTSVHVYKDAGTAERNEKNMEVRLDMRVSDAESVRALGIEVGDFVSFDPRTQIINDEYIKSRHLDDKASVAILLQVIDFINDNQLELPHTTHFLISNNEEIGYGGNSNIPEETVEYLAVDMGALGDGQTSDEYTVSICAKDGSGPYHLGLRKHLVELAEKNNIDYKVDIYPYYASDASAAIHAGNDIVHGLIGPGVDASHAYERTHRDSLYHTEKLVYAYLFSNILK
ncbi:M42 family metallopeptidase [Listeria immobilis]|uniref:M42 family metallopeptidase n=1 Tax=Listeria immobilis TaxID=2713502 RepID=A0ABR6SRM6_9LIST|nr:M42 family metallopeptidase [Listeria immobilis]MBC1482959.1 M42 family metallopeptidase [Listeria immobilis]MBC1505885.1 M42 family metallopeptidase [Listeria immobilis]MBC1508324.1 M42 family metallopeptidase [Listeria immobilis]MBC1514979.1 M42 family metallopeptidase [Listeria immobilis]MBC6302980.1 M42 family metallopeptidase [Listeria immobilis]